MQIKNNPRSINKEIIILRKLGLSDEEVQYLIWKELKNKINKKWERKYH